jgi:hypothetical protein
MTGGMAMRRMSGAVAGLLAAVVFSNPGSTLAQAADLPLRPPFGTTEAPIQRSESLPTVSQTQKSGPVRPPMGGGDSLSPSAGDSLGLAPQGKRTLEIRPAFGPQR